jgi:hypothetical protein
MVIDAPHLGVLQTEDILWCTPPIPPSPTSEFTALCMHIRGAPLFKPAADHFRTGQINLRARLAAEQETKRGDFRALIIFTFGNYQ